MTDHVTIDFWFDVLTREPGVSPPDLRDAPPWFRIDALERPADPSPLYRPEGARDVLADNPSIESAWRTMLRVRMSPGTRPEADVHLQYGIQVAASLALANRGFVLDGTARRLMSGESFADTCAPAVENHVTYAIDRDGIRVCARSRGMAKFGFLDVALESPDSGPESDRVALGLVDLVCTGLVIDEYRSSAPFEMAGGREWRVDAKGGMLELELLSPEPLAELLATIARGMEA